MKNFVEYLVKNLVDNPNDVNVNCEEDSETFTVEIRVNALDVGKVVGKGGKTIKSLRLIASLAATRIGRRVRLVLMDE